MIKIHPKYDRVFVNKALDMIQNFLQRTLKGQNKVASFMPPKQLRQAINFNVDNQPCSQQHLLTTCQAILQHQVKPYHPHFHNQLFGGFDQYSYIGAMMTPSINGSVYTYQISPCYTLMEQTIFEQLRKIVQWKQIDGTMTPGGSFANFMGILMARFNKFPQINKKGMYGMKPLKIYTSQSSHYSVKKGVVLCGLGTQNIISVKSDQNRKMIPQQLQKAILQEISQGNNSFAVFSTVGTTVEGNIDPVTQIGQICKKYGLWHHVDAAFGGAFMMHQELNKKIGSYQNVDSITFDPHKGLVVPLHATFFLCRHKGLMGACNSANAEYLFHKQRASYSSELDVGDKHLQCSRVIDVLKLWTYLKGNGWKIVGEQVLSQHQLALHLKKYILQNPERFRLVVKEVETFNVCFWYIPQKLKLQNFNNQDEFFSLVSKITVLAKKYMIEEGKILVGYSKSKLPYYFWRHVMSNPYKSKQEAEFTLNQIGRYCQMAYEELIKVQV